MNPGVDLHLAQVPYLGLRPFEVDEADIFFGRERQTDDLLRRLSQTHFLPIVGPSGCGKSSLVRAGLLASLESGFIVEAGGRWRILTMMPRDRPIEELANAILQRLSEPDESKLIALQAVLRSGPRGLIEALKEIPVVPGENLLLLVDQFEEIFRFRDQLASRVLTDGAGPQDQKRKDEADAFVTLLLEAVKEKAAYVVLTMRSDFLRDCSLFSGLPEAFNRSMYLTPRLDRDDLQSAIQEPARVLGGSLQPDLVRQLINDARSNQDQLPLMQHVLMRMWSNVVQTRPNTPPELTVEDYGRVGALSKALCQDADDAFDKELTPEQQRIAEVMFKALCVRGSSDRDTRAPARLDHVADVAEVKWEEVVPVVEVFRGAGRYFLSPRSGPLAPDTVLDITHESLIRNWKRLSQWVEEEALSAETYQRLVRDAVDWKEGGDLLSPIRLSSLNAWEKRFHPTEPWSQRYGGQFALATEYLETSRKQREKEAQDAALAQQKLYLKENAIKGLGLALAAAVAVVSWAVYKTIAANANYGSALAIKAQLEWRSQNALSAWPYAASVSRYNKGLADLALFNDPPEPKIQYYRQIRHRCRVAALAISPDGKTLFAALNDGSIDRIDPQTGSLENFAASPSGTKADAAPCIGNVETAQLAFSPDGERLYFFTREFGLRVLSLPDGNLLPLPQVFPVIPAEWKITSFGIDPNGAFAFGFENGKLMCSPNGSSKLTITELRSADSPSASPTPTPSSNTKGTSITNSERGEGRSGISNLAFSQDGKTIAGISGTEGKLRIWQVVDAQVVRELDVQTRPPDSDSATAPNPPVSPLSTVLFYRAMNDALMLASPEGKIFLASLEENSGSLPETPPPPSRRNSPPPSKKPRTRLPQSAPPPSVPPQPEQPAENTRWLKTIRSPLQPKSDELELTTTSQSTRAKKVSTTEGIVMAALDPSGEGYCWVTSDGRLSVWWPEEVDLRSNEKTLQLFVRAHDDGATALAVSPSGSWLATGGGDGATRIWKISTIETLARAELKKMPPIRTVASGPSGKIIAIGSDATGTRVLRDDKVQPFPDLAPKETPGETPDAMYLSSDGSSVVVSFGQTVHILDTATFQERTPVEGVSLTHWGFNGPILATQEGAQNVALWDASTGKKLGSILAAKESIVDIMFGSGRDQIAIATDANRISIWDIRDPAQPREARSMDTGESQIKFIAFSEAENTIAAATSDKVMLFDAKTGARLPVISVPPVPIVMVFNALGTLLALGFEDGSVSVWDWKNSAEPTPISGSEGFASALAITSDNQLVTGGADGRVRFWDLKGKLAKILPRRPWHPKDPDDAARLSGLKLENLEVRFLRPEEEKDLKIDASIPLDQDGLGEYWRAVRETIRDFATLEKTRELSAEAIKKADHLARWLDTHKERSDVATRTRVQMATELRDTLRDNLAKSLQSQAQENYGLKHYDVALAAVQEVITLEKERTDASDATDKTLTDSMASLVLLRGRLLVAQHSPEALKDFETLAAGESTGIGALETKALAHVYLAYLDHANLGAAERYCADQVKLLSVRSVFHYCLAAVFAIRSTSPGADQAKDVKAAIDSLKIGLALRNYSLRMFVDSTPFLTNFEQDKLKELLSKEEERERKKSEADAAK